MKRILIATFSLCLAFGLIASANHSCRNSAQAQIETAQAVTPRSSDKCAECDRVTATAIGKATSQTNFGTQVTLAVHGENFGCQ